MARRHPDKLNDDLGSIFGSKTGQTEHSTVSGGWAGTDDATSTAPSDQIGNPTDVSGDDAIDSTTVEFDGWFDREANLLARVETERDERRELEELAEERRSEMHSQHLEGLLKVRSAHPPRTKCNGYL